MIRYWHIAHGLILTAMLASMLALTACGKEQLRHFSHDVCARTGNCTNYGKGGEQNERWDP